MQLRGNYIRKYETATERDADRWSENYYEPWVSAVVENGEVDYNRPQPLTFSALQNGTIYVETLSNSGNLYLERDIKYIKNGQISTISLNGNNKQSTIQVSAGDVLYFFGDNDIYCEYDETAGTDVFVRIRAVCNVNISGNILSLLKSRDWEEEKLDREYSFAYLFSNSSVVSAEDLILPDKVSPWCLSRLFKDCAKLTNAPVLPSEDVEAGCYCSMFKGCISLTTAPTLPNISVAKEYCYASMFERCVNLEHNIPVSLPATEVSQYSYSGMFNDCRKLRVAPTLPATTVAPYCYQYMFAGCTALLTGPELPATTVAPYCYQYMFSGCTALTSATETLPGLVVETNSYRGMFKGCVNLEVAPKVLAESFRSTGSWSMAEFLSGCTKIDSFVCLIQYFFGYTATNGWLDGVKEPGTFYKSPLANEDNVRYNQGAGGARMPDSWVIVDYTG